MQSHQLGLKPVVTQYNAPQAGSNAHGPHYPKLAQMAATMNASPQVQQLRAASELLQRAPSRTEPPDRKQSGIKSLLGPSTDHVQAYRNSARPAQLSTYSAPLSLQRHPHDYIRGEPIIQRQVVATKANSAGTFTFDYKSNSKTLDDIYCGIEMQIDYKLRDSAPDESRLYMSQIAKNTNLLTNQPYNWSGSAKKGEQDEAARDLVRTSGQFGEEPGYFIDQFYSTSDQSVGALNKPRSFKLDPERSIAYNTLGVASHGHDGRKNSQAGINQPASLKDAPGSGAPMKFSFETAALGKDNGSFGILPWRVVLGKKDELPVLEIDNATDGESINFREAKYEFNEFFRNPGSSTSPERFNALTNIGTNGLGGLREALQTTSKLVARAERVQALPDSDSRTSLLQELKEAIQYRVVAIAFALDDTELDPSDQEDVAFFRRQLDRLKIFAVQRLGALDF